MIVIAAALSIVAAAFLALAILTVGHTDRLAQRLALKHESRPKLMDFRGHPCSLTLQGATAPTPRLIPTHPKSAEQMASAASTQILAAPSAGEAKSKF
jgi:hypothetical protein